MFSSLFGKEEFSAESLAKYLSKLDGDITCLKKFPPREPSYAGFAGIDPQIIQALKARGVPSLYTHQNRAVSLALAGQDIVIVTPTASGKTLCYNLPVINSLLHDPDSRALYLFPTKALAQDQLTELGRFSEELGRDIRAFTYDGDTPREARAAAKEGGQIIITNPDMLNVGILPYHTYWAKFFQNLNYIVVDELHTYRGVFGSHLANLFSRLLRICEFYNSKPVFICCSATIANPAEHAKALTGRNATLISENGAPSPEKDFMIYNPPIVNRRAGIRRSSLFEVSRIASEALAANVSTIVFTRSRLNVELILKAVRKELVKRGLDPETITGYRAGYLPKERRAIERALRGGKLRGVVSTNALELGIDIGSLDLAILHGYPGSIASAWQQIGRAGRRGSHSAAVMVPSALAMDQFLAAKPEWFLGAPPELARIDPMNPYIQVGHVRCSAFELPFRQGETFGGQDIEQILEFLAAHNVLHKAEGDGEVSYYWQDDSYPAAGLSLRSATGDTYTITDISNAGRARVIGSMDKHSAPTMIYPGAVYFHGGQSYIVQELSEEELLCKVKLANVDYYTEAESTAHINITDEFENDGVFGWGDAVVATTPYMYKKIRLTTHENIGHGKIDLPEEKMETTAAWIAVPDESVNSPDLKIAVDGFKNLLRNTAPLFLMCDREDIQIHDRIKDPRLKRPAIFIADTVPGGVGMAEGVYEIRGKLSKACLDVLDSCGCRDGCPACVGAASDDFDTKSSVRRLIKNILSQKVKSRP